MVGVGIERDIWRYKRSRRWYRALTADEQAAYESDSNWGLYKYRSNHTEARALRICEGVLPVPS